MSISGGSNRILLDLNVHKVLATAATTTAAAAATVSQELWTSGGALFQRAQEPNIPCGESLTSIEALENLNLQAFVMMLATVCSGTILMLQSMALVCFRLAFVIENTA